MDKVRWGIAGLGNIAGKFARDLVERSEFAQLYAVAAREQSAAKTFADQNLCPVYYGSYLALAEDPNVDAVYVATVHTYHRPLVELFLRHGKHVLVEKPAFTNVSDFDEMQSLADSEGLLLIEAMKSVTFPAYQKLKMFIVEQGLVIKKICAAFGFNLDYDPSHRLFDRELSGGATLDVGIYPLWLYVDLCHLMGVSAGLPKFTHSQQNEGSEVDETVSFQFEGDICGDLSASITQQQDSAAVIGGDNFEIIVRGKWWNPQTIDIVLDGQSSCINSPSEGAGLHYEMDHVSQLIANKESYSRVINRKVSREVISIMEYCLVNSGYEYLVKKAD